MPDISEIMKQAKEISRIMGNSEKNSNENINGANNFDMFKFIEMMNFMKSAQALTGADKEEEHSSREDNVPRNILALKAMAPHFGGVQGKNIAMLASIMELSHIINGFDSAVNAASVNLTPFGKRRNILSAVRKYIDDDKKYILDIAIKAMDLREAMEKSKALGIRY